MLLFKENYYYFVAGLQDVTIDTDRLVFDNNALQKELRDVLSKKDYLLYQKILLPIDNQNLLNILNKADISFNELGSFSKEELEANIREPYSLPEYMQKFINAFKENEPIYPSLSWENQLLSLFYDEVLQDKNEFIRNWYELDYNVKNILTGVLCKKHKMSLETQIIGNNDIAKTIKASQSSDLGLTGIVDYIEDIINIAQNSDAIEREKAIDVFKWNYLNEMIFFEYFTIDRILTFVIKTNMIERWLKIDTQYGNELFGMLQKELKSSFKLKELFTDNE